MVEVIQGNPLTKAEPKVTQEPVTPEKPVDLVSRVSQFKVQEDAPKTDTPTYIQGSDEVTFDYSKLNEIRTPEEAKAFAESAHKSFQKGYNQKFQDLANQRKELETMKQQLQQAKQWTPESVQALTQDPEFVRAAEIAMQTQNPANSGMSDSEWSALSDGEKAKLTAMEQEIRSLKQQNMQAYLTQQNEQLKTKYANYDADQVNKLVSDLQNRKVIATNEHLWKVIDYEDATKRAYEMGRADERNLKGEKVEAASYGLGVDVRKEGKLEPSNGETNEEFFNKLYRYNMSQKKAGQLRT